MDMCENVYCAPLLHAPLSHKRRTSRSSQVLFWLLSLGVRAGRAHDAVLPQEVPQDLILGLPVFHLRGRTLLILIPKVRRQRQQRQRTPTSCRSSWLSILSRSRELMSSPSFRLLWRSSLMYSHALDRIPPLLWERKTVVTGVGLRVHSRPLNKAWTHLTRLGVINVAVRDGLGQLHDPVVDLISAPPLHCRNRNPNIQRRFPPLSTSRSPLKRRWGWGWGCGGPPSLCCARRFSSLEPRGASCFLDKPEKEGS